MTDFEILLDELRKAGFDSLVDSIEFQIEQRDKAEVNAKIDTICHDYLNNDLHRRDARSQLYKLKDTMEQAEAILAEVDDLRRTRERR